ncbi:MAG: hypothetical protein VX619_02965 [bacterium]|nr:hypothetical protein [bacterium]
MAKLKIDYLLFDLGNVFLYWNKNLFLKHFIKGLPDKNLRILEYSNPYWLDLISYESKLEKGHLNWMQFCESVEIKYKWRGCPDSLLKSFQDIFEPNQKLIDWFLSTEFECHTILMSNTNVYHWNWISENYGYLLSKFDHLHLSQKVGFRKPSKEYYLGCLYKLEWNRALFIDDLAENLVIPKELGAVTHCFRDNKLLWRHLNRCTF